jgi:DNA-binding NarL/FixJ family response regulator
MIHVMIVDDHLIVREGLSRILSLEPDIDVTVTASNAEEAIAALRPSVVDVVLLDISLPGRSGLDILPDLFRLAPDIAVLMLSMHPEKLMATRAIRAGARGYLTKETDPEELIRAIRRVHDGRKYITPEVADALTEHIQADTGGELYEQLSNREMQVLQHFARGLRAAQIADELKISARTVGTYRGRILEKLQLRTTADLIRYALEKRLLG